MYKRTLNWLMLFFANTNNFEAFNFLINHGADIKAQDKAGNMAINWFAYHNNVEAVTYIASQHPELLDHIDSFGETAFARFAHLGNLKFVLKLASIYPKGLDTINKSEMTVALTLIVKDKDPNGATIVALAKINPNVIYQYGGYINKLSIPFWLAYRRCGTALVELAKMENSILIQRDDNGDWITPLLAEQDNGKAIIEFVRINYRVIYQHHHNGKTAIEMLMDNHNYDTIVELVKICTPIIWTRRNNLPFLSSIASDGNAELLVRLAEIVPAIRSQDWLMEIIINSNYHEASFAECEMLVDAGFAKPANIAEILAAKGW